QRRHLPDLRRHLPLTKKITRRRGGAESDFFGKAAVSIRPATRQAFPQEALLSSAPPCRAIHRHPLRRVQKERARARKKATAKTPSPPRPAKKAGGRTAVPLHRAHAAHSCPHSHVATERRFFPSNPWRGLGALCALAVASFRGIRSRRRDGATGHLTLSGEA